MTQREREQNLMIVAAGDGYAAKYGPTIDQVFKRFWEYDFLNVLRSCHDTLHTQSLGESAAFVDDYQHEICG